MNQHAESQMNAPHTEPVKHFADQKVNSDICSASEFVCEAMRDKLDGDQQESPLAAKLTKGLRSGKPLPYVRDHFTRKKQALVDRRKCKRK